MSVTRLTTDLLEEILITAGMLSPEQAREMKIKQDVQRMKLLKARGVETAHRGRMHIEDEVSPIEMAASLNFTLPGSPAKTLTEDLATEAVAKHAGLPFRKIDPLKLNPEITTQILPRAFARRSVSIPLDRQDEKLTIARRCSVNQLPVAKEIVRRGG